MKPQIKLAFTTGTDDLNRRLSSGCAQIFPELPLWVVSDFPPEDGDLKWIPWRMGRGFRENLARCRAELGGYRVRLAAVMLVPNVPFRRMRLAALLLSPAGFLAFNENLNDFMLRPRCLPRHPAPCRLARQEPAALERPRRPRRRLARPLLVRGRARGRLPAAVRRAALPPARRSRAPGISVVIPSRNGRELLAAQIAGIARDLGGIPLGDHRGR